MYQPNCEPAAPISITYVLFKNNPILVNLNTLFDESHEKSHQNRTKTLKKLTLHCLISVTQFAQKDNKSKEY